VIDFWWEYIGSFAQSPALSGGAKAAQMFRSRAALATAAGFVGAFPNFYWVHRGLGFVSGTVFLRRTGAEWRDVPLAELGNVALEDFEGRMKATNVYAKDKGFEGGFPNYFHADYGHGIVCGTILLKSGAAEWRDVRLAELKNPALDDIEARFKATQDYARKHDFEGGFPDFFHDEKLKIDPQTGQRTRYIVCGTVLVKPEFISTLAIGAPRRMPFAEWRDV
jgi:hypothetical protein